MSVLENEAEGSIERSRYVDDPGCVKTFFVPQNCTQPGTIRVDTTIWAYFCIIEFGVNPGASSGHAERP
jgi:hypothetical protein